MPEMPEVQALTEFLATQVIGRQIRSIRVAAIAALKTFDPPLHALEGQPVADVHRHGKFIELRCGEASLVFHLARAGWLRWYDQAPTGVVRPGKTPLALRLTLDSGAGFDLTEAGTKKSLAVYVVRSAQDVPGIARLGPDPTAAGFTLADFTAILQGRRTQLKGVLRDQSVFAGIGNAYSDEILHVAKLSPYLLAAKLTDAQLAVLFQALRETIAHATAVASGRPPAELKDAKRAGMRVHGRTGQPCPECGDTVREVTFTDSAFQYCPTCQTGGKPLADRVLSRLLK
ncbi:MAG TPA: DNA-formamidopyrimidine glycosylase family protein [Candidatus Lumbricidophila sp.]|nr:DNA-formamidopyrimidine glycosylase family protein [Candidatus Lumbricidophila sp.]